MYCLKFLRNFYVSIMTTGNLYYLLEPDMSEQVENLKIVITAITSNNMGL
jgi:hypothetical protein